MTALRRLFGMKRALVCVLVAALSAPAAAQSTVGLGVTLPFFWAPYVQYEHALDAKGSFVVQGAAYSSNTGNLHHLAGGYRRYLGDAPPSGLFAYGHGVSTPLFALFWMAQLYGVEAGVGYRSQVADKLSLEGSLGGMLPLAWTIGESEGEFEGVNFVPRLGFSLGYSF